MNFTVLKIFNQESFGLTGPHYAVVTTLPEDLGGARRVIDVLPVSDESNPGDVAEGFKKAAESLPYRLNEDGGEIDFLSRDFKGSVIKTSTAYIPHRPVTGGDFTDALLGWLCWRARVSLWADRDRVVLSPADEEKLLRVHLANSVTEMEAVPPAKALTVYAATREGRRNNQSGAGQDDAQSAVSRKVPLTLGIGPV